MPPQLSDFYVGAGVTICHHSDRHAATIIAVSDSGKTIQVKRDLAKRLDKNGMSEDQHYSYQRDPLGLVTTFRLNKKGQYVGKGGRPILASGRREYYDYSF